ncbi:MAG: hypothetical protein AAFR33_05025 [Pseudomonadota bacterium]
MEHLAVPLAFLISLAVCAMVGQYGAKDVPDGGRKDHERPVSTLGGLGIAFGHLGALAWFLSFGDNGKCLADCGRFVPVEWGWPILIAFGLGFLVTGLIDDLRPMAARTKLVLLAWLSVGVCLAFWYGLGGSDGPFGSLRHAEWLLAGGALWVFVLSNATNFMDGSNGLALGCSAIMLVALFMLGAPTAALVSAIIGFLVFNLTGGLFAGDTGAFYVGFWVAALSLLGAALGEYSIWVPPLIALPFLTDIILTILWRGRRGGNVMQAHREHAYQLLRRSGWGHLRVALLWWGMTAVCGALALFAANAFDWRGEMAVFAVTLAVSIALWIWQRRTYWPRVSAPG